MSKCDFNEVTKQSNSIEIALRPRCFPLNLLHIFRACFLKSTSGRMLLKVPDRDI